MSRTRDAVTVATWCVPMLALAVVSDGLDLVCRGIGVFQDWVTGP